MLMSSSMQKDNGVWMKFGLQMRRIIAKFVIQSLCVYAGR